jgi:hypothetical protein
LIEEVFRVRVGHEFPAYLPPQLFVQLPPVRYPCQPLLGNLRQDVQAGANVRAALGVVRGDSQQRVGEVRGAVGIGDVEPLTGIAKTVGRLRPYFVAREQRHMHIERSIFYPFGGGGDAKLLKPLDETDAAQTIGRACFGMLLEE